LAISRRCDALVSRWRRTERPRYRSRGWRSNVWQPHQSLCRITVDKSLPFGGPLRDQTKRFIPGVAEKRLTCFGRPFPREHPFAPPAEFDLVSRGRSHDKNVDGQVLCPLLSQGQLKFKAGSRGAKLLVEQLQDLPCGEHDDAPDALEVAFRLAYELLARRAEEELLARPRPVPIEYRCW
jgi:hypothetical protein